ncbi:MAG: peptidylprolyl isomerase [Patescibacteria group bacterium]|nr:peptidylprolyl isomerase [Patescibacteria group bacterium]
MKKIIVAATILASTLTACGGKQAGTSNPIVMLETTQGQIEVEINTKLTPQTAANFLELVHKGFYNGLKFHRYVPDFVIQGGDPLGDGTGGSGKEIQLEIPCADGTAIIGETTECKPALPHNAGVIAMARSMSPNSASSQFYFTLASQPSLDGKYAVFGKVVKGLDVVQKLRQGDAMNNVYEVGYTASESAQSKAK